MGTTTGINDDLDLDFKKSAATSFSWQAVYIAVEEPFSALKQLSFSVRIFVLSVLTIYAVNRLQRKYYS
jgi:hypothetical protein